MKKFVNDPAKFVPEMLEGIFLANEGKLKYEPKYNLIYRADRPSKDHVSVIQGSGSGHEPAHVMTVGRGMLDAASPGNVFAAPPMEYCLECIKLMKSPKGVLVLINNYQGDRMNWDMAIEMAEAEGINVKSFIIDDDVAVQNSSYTIGRRGVAGNFFVMKACGAAAEKGASLDDLLALAKKVNANVRSMGIALTSCTPPAKGKPIFEIGDDEMEVGVGIHGEPGRRRDKLKPADAIVDELFDAVAKDLPFKSGDRVALMVNGLGGTPPSELYVLYRKAALRSKTAGLNIVRNYVGNYCTSLEMAGASLTLLKLDKEIEELLARAIAHAVGARGDSTSARDPRHEAALAAFLVCYRDNLFVRSRLYPEVVATLDALRARGLRLCCITNKRQAFSDRLLADAGISDGFELVLGGDALPEKKPSPLPLNVAAERLGVPAAAATLVGDSHQDLRAARAAGYGFVLASYGYGKIDETELGAVPRIRRFADLPVTLGVDGVQRETRP